MKHPQPLIRPLSKSAANFAALKAAGFQGADASLEVSLLEYDLAWKNPTENDPDFVFLNKLPGDRGFGLVRFPADLTPEKEWNFVEWPKVAAFAGTTRSELLSEPLPYVVGLLLRYYGRENVFGSGQHTAFILPGEQSDPLDPVGHDVLLACKVPIPGKDTSPSIRL